MWTEIKIYSIQTRGLTPVHNLYTNTSKIKTHSFDIFFFTLITKLVKVVKECIYLSILCVCVCVLTSSYVNNVYPAIRFFIKLSLALCPTLCLSNSDVMTQNKLGLKKYGCHSLSRTDFI